MLSIIHPDDRVKVRQLLFKKPAEQSIGVLHYKILHHNGKWRHHEATYRNLLDHPDIQGILINYRDISERIEAEEMARARERQLGHMSRCKTMGELATALAHELNQPLAALNNYVGGSIIRIQNGLANTTETLDAMNAALDQTKRVNQIIHSMRSFLRKGEANFQVHSLNKLIQDLHPLIGLKADQGGCTIHYEMSVTPVSISADETLFSQVILIWSLMRWMRCNVILKANVISISGPGSTTSMPELPLQTMVRDCKDKIRNSCSSLFIRARKTAWGSD